MKRLALLIVLSVGLASIVGGCSGSIGKMDCYTAQNSKGEMQTICH